MPAHRLVERAIEHRDNNDYRTVYLEYILRSGFIFVHRQPIYVTTASRFNLIRMVLFVLHFVWLLLKKVVLFIKAKLW